ncbi:MAG: cytochrome c, partial [bacterium]|nr:cytochrome c [bacterium]
TPAPPASHEAPEPVSAPVVPAPEMAATAVGSPAAPEQVTLAEAHRFEAVVTGATAGLTERVAASLPRWLTVLFFAVPLIGLTYLIAFAGGANCGAGGQLSVDRLTGLVENCDGSVYEAGSAAGGVDVRALVGEGSALYAAPSSCSSCHGASGEGGSGPALAGTLLDTFSMCTDHIEWVSLGTDGFLGAGRNTYGDAGTTVGSGGVMPSFNDTLTPQEIATVVFYERVVLGGQDVEEAVFDCGFAEPEVP